MNYLKSTSCYVAKEMGYSTRAIHHCYEEGINAGDLVMKILDLEEIDPSFRYDVDEYNNGIKEESYLTDLRQETIQLWKKQYCRICWKKPSNMLALPCTHLVLCDSCHSRRCIVCDEVIWELLKVHI